MKWQDLFEDKILERGMDYYRQNAVEYLNKKGSHYYAIVNGNRDYEVNVEVENSIIKHIDCSCPYDFSCKHMVAVIHEIEEQYETIDGYELEDEQSPHSLPINSDISYKELVDSCEIEVLKDFVLELLQENTQYVYKLRDKMNHSELETDCMWLYRKVDSIMNTMYPYDYDEDYDDYNDYERDESWKYDLGRMLEVECIKYVNSDLIELGFKLSYYIFQRLVGIDCDDDYLLNKCVNVWKETVAKKNEKLNQAIFTTCMSFLTSYHGWKYRKYVEEIILNEYNSMGYYTCKMNYINGRLEALRGFKDTYTIDKYLVVYIIPKLNLMRLNRENIEEPCKAYWKYKQVKEWYVEYCMDNTMYERAIDVLLECLEYPLCSDEDNIMYRTKLKDLYKLTNKQQEYTMSLYTLLQTGNLDIYRETKALYSDEDWNKRKDKIIQSMESSWARCMYYSEEQMYDELLQEVCEDDGFMLLEKYESTLVALYPNAILDIYTKRINKDAEMAYTRYHYHCLVDTLKKMDKIEGGKECVNKIKADWLVRYKRKSAMMEILRKY